MYLNSAHIASDTEGHKTSLDCHDVLKIHCNDPESAKHPLHTCTPSEQACSPWEQSSRLQPPPPSTIIIPPPTLSYPIVCSSITSYSPLRFVDSANLACTLKSAVASCLENTFLPKAHRIGEEEKKNIWHSRIIEKNLDHTNPTNSDTSGASHPASCIVGQIGSRRALPSKSQLHRTSHTESRANLGEYLRLVTGTAFCFPSFHDGSDTRSDAMNGSEAQEVTAAVKASQPLTKDTQPLAEAQTPTQAEPPLMAGANGSSSMSKKRKKDGLKPIITTEAPSPTGESRSALILGKDIHGTSASWKDQSYDASLSIAHTWGKSQTLSEVAPKPAAVELAESLGGRYATLQDLILKPDQSACGRGIVNWNPLSPASPASRSGLI
ncbi:hypothetical protein BKA67DRAFT_532614 [Truncatella angustata]|uniref:Uncharacterized protein n=1 Tax=Truncatella angustata TaxID=152316 RepID=A0A9P8US88_9PEZI|nr:uncharacterized protein BKA67DRAFT_532614 [Truncatella angustata]KAH6657403.1 hypothetical protein BKA67DRAFT_532614 [Truncatella angustata]